MKTIYIYLSGTIKKSHDKDNLSQWEFSHLSFMKELFAQRNYNVHFLNPAIRSDDLSDEFSLFGRDMLQTYLSSFVITDMREKRGIGVGYEVAFANSKNIPVIIWAEKNSHYRPLKCEVVNQILFDWTHPFVSQTSKFIANNLLEAVEFITSYQLTSKKPINKGDYVLPAMLHYLNSQLSQDTEMYKLIENSVVLKEQVSKILDIK